MTPTTKFKAALSGLALIAAAVLPINPANAATAVPQTVSAEAVAAAKPVPTLGYSTQTVKTLNIDFQYQQTGYWCGPAAT